MSSPAFWWGGLQVHALQQDITTLMRGASSGIVQLTAWLSSVLIICVAGVPPEALGRSSVEAVATWNRDKERWDALWRSARVRAAPIPKALALCLGPLRIPQGVVFVDL